MVFYLTNTVTREIVTLDKDTEDASGIKVALDRWIISDERGIQSYVGMFGRVATFNDIPYVALTFTNTPRIHILKYDTILKKWEHIRRDRN